MIELKEHPKPVKVSFEADRLNRVEAAAFLGLQPSTLTANVTTKRLKIPMYKIGRRVFYKKSQLQVYIDNCEVPM
ncbi:MAG: hypothetical protein NTX38_11240 [Methylobacter sp.]|nr:hypothetical protein [Methylobacter sp.]